ncbi:MAG: hypothetical protein ACOY3I_05915 [Verrucomicrobiota bacterium]
MSKKKTGKKGKKTTPVMMWAVIGLIVFGIWWYYSHHPSSDKCLEEKEFSADEKIRKMLRENPDAEIFKDAENATLRHKKKLNAPSE